MTHDFFMHHCLQLASQGLQSVGNGAMVGSVLVRNGHIVAEGYHKKYGELHAERYLLEKYDPASPSGLRRASQKIRSEDLLYVSLEPCCHTGKNSPCMDIILEKGVKHVVVGMLDPDTRVSGKGIFELRAAGVHVIGPIIPTECAWLNRGFVSVRTKRRPWITLKSARAADGKIANDDGSPLSITSDAQNVWTHTHLRAEHDAIVVGVQTVINDDPVLDARRALTRLRPLGSAGQAPSPSSLDRGEYHPWRIILDPQLRIPQAAKVLNDAHAQKTIVITTPENIDRASALQSNGAMVLGVPKNADGFDWAELWSVLLSPQGNDFNGITSILVEGGEKTWEMFKKAGMVDVEVCLIGK